MKKYILAIILFFSILLVTGGCEKQTKDKPDNLDDTYKAISYYFSNSKVDKSNLGAFYIDKENNIIIVELVENTSENQEKFLKLINIDKQYIKFIQGGPYQDNNLDIELSVDFEQTCGTVEFNNYLTQHGMTIYLEENINDLYIIDAKKKMTFKEYATSVNQTLDRSVENLTDKLEVTDTLKDGGTTIYKNKDKNITVIACNTLKNNKDVYIGDYQLDFKENMCK